MTFKHRVIALCPVRDPDAKPPFERVEEVVTGVPLHDLADQCEGQDQFLVILGRCNELLGQGEALRGRHAVPGHRFGGNRSDLRVRNAERGDRLPKVPLPRSCLRWVGRGAKCLSQYDGGLDVDHHRNPTLTAATPSFTGVESVGGA